MTIFFQRRHKNSQQVHEKVFNFTNYQKNANQNHSEILTHSCQKGYHQKDQEITNVGENTEKRQSLCTVGENVKWYSHYEKQCIVSSKKAIPLQGIYPMEMKSGSQRDICTPMFTANDTRSCLKTQKHHFADKGLSSKSYGFSSSDVQL